MVYPYVYDSWGDRRCWSSVVDEDWRRTRNDIVGVGEGDREIAHLLVAGVVVDGDDVLSLATGSNEGGAAGFEFRGIDPFPGAGVPEGVVGGGLDGGGRAAGCCGLRSMLTRPVSWSVYSDW